MGHVFRVNQATLAFATREHGITLKMAITPRNTDSKQKVMGLSVQNLLVWSEIWKLAPMSQHWNICT